MGNLAGLVNPDAPPAEPMDVVPAGDYIAQIVNSEMRATKDGGGQYLWLEMAIIDGPMTNRRLFDRLNLVNGNQTAAEIAQRTLNAIIGATGQVPAQVSDSQQLHMKPMIVTVKVKPAGPDKGGIQRDAQNEVRGYKPANGPAPKTAATPAATKVAYMPPWKKNAF
jgi:hypothetical protein